MEVCGLDFLWFMDWFGFVMFVLSLGGGGRSKRDKGGGLHLLDLNAF